MKLRAEKSEKDWKIGLICMTDSYGRIGLFKMDGDMYLYSVGMVRYGYVRNELLFEQM